MLVFNQTKKKENMFRCNIICHKSERKYLKKKKKKVWGKKCTIVNTPTDKYVNSSSVNKDIKVCVN